MQKKNYTSAFKVKIVLEVLREEHSLSEISAGYDINPNQVARWKREFLERAPELFNNPKLEKNLRNAVSEAEEEKARMLKAIGQLTMERDYLKAATERLNDRRLL